MSEGLSKVKSIFTKRVVIVLATVLALFIIFYPHTERTKVNAELTGVFVVQKERYILHQRVELETNFICISGQTVKSTSVHYSLLGPITKTVTENCNGTSSQASYNSDGTLQYQKTTTFVNNLISTTIGEYTKTGQLLKTYTDFDGTYNLQEQEYTNNKLTKITGSTSVYGDKTDEFIYTYDEDGVRTLNKTTSWKNGDIDTDISTTYKEGKATNVEYTNASDEIEATIVCNDDFCTLNTLTGPFYSVVYNLSTLKYDLDVVGETATSNILFQQITADNYLTIFNYIESRAQILKDAQ